MSNQQIKPQKFDLFISYSHKDSAFVSKLSAELKIMGMNVWLDEKAINVGDSVVSEIRKGIDNSKYFVIVVSKNSINSKWVERETDIATNIELKQGRIIVLPILLEGTILPWFLEGKLFADFRNSYAKGLSKLTEALDPEKDIFFEVNKTVDFLNINDVTGSEVILEKEWDISILRGEMTKWLYCLQGSTENFGIIDVSPNIIATQSKCHIKHSFNLKFPYPLIAGDQTKITLKVLIKDAYLNSEEWWSVHKPSQSCSDCIVTKGVVKEHIVKILFPQDRPYKSFRGELFKGNTSVKPKNKVIASEENFRKTLTWEIDREYDHTLWWNW